MTELHLTLVCSVLSLVGVWVYLSVRFLGRRSAEKPKAFVQEMSYCPIGPGGKAGVGVVKVGRELLLVGVTPNHVSALMPLKDMPEEYLAEKSERSTFKEAVEEEYRRLKRTPELTT